MVRLARITVGLFSLGLYRVAHNSTSTELVNGNLSTPSSCAMNVRLLYMSRELNDNIFHTFFGPRLGFFLPIFLVRQRQINLRIAGIPIDIRRLQLDHNLIANRNHRTTTTTNLINTF